MLILDAIRDHVVPIEQRLHSGEIFEPGCTPSELRHAFAQHVLRPMLPQRYGLTEGRAFSIDDDASQADSVLIFDMLHALPLGRHMPCEIIYAACEITPELDRQHFEASVRNIASLKQLHRAKATAHDVTPTHHLGVFGARYAQLADDKLNPYLGFIFTDDSDDADALLKQLNDLIEEGAIRPEHTPDAIACFRCGWLITRQTRTGEAAVPRSSFAKFGLWHPNAHLLPLIYVLLNISLSQIQLRGPDLLRPLSALTKLK